MNFPLGLIQCNFQFSNFNFKIITTRKEKKLKKSYTLDENEMLALIFRVLIHVKDLLVLNIKKEKKLNQRL